jgi:hypothetical protein
MCEEFNMGGGRFPPKCLPRLQALEDQPSPLATYIQHEVVTQTAKGPVYYGVNHENPLADEVMPFTLAASVRWGYIDVGGYLKQCPCVKNIGCVCPPIVSSQFGTILYATTGILLEEYRTVFVSGTFKQVQASMLNMTFIPETMFNYLRVKHRLLSPTSTRLQAWFQVDFRVNNNVLSFTGVNWNNPTDTKAYLDQIETAILKKPVTSSQIIHVIPKNNAPTVTDPQVGYVRGCITSTPCNTKFTIIENEGYNYHYGQYWRWEGSSDPLMISGINIDDPDVDENCLYNEQNPTTFLETPNLAYRCGRLDFNVRTAIGTVALNMRDNLFFYADERSAIGFTATVKEVKSAVRALYYRVDTPDRIASGISQVLQTNTQYVGAKEEFIFIRIADQGLVGADGIAQEARDSQGNPGLRINVTIAALNNAPTLKTPLDFSVDEDQPKEFSGLVVEDVDSNEVTTSTLALEEWLNKRWNQRYLNRVRITLELKGFSNQKGRGYLYLPVTARDLFIVSNASQTFVSVESLFPDHNLCAFWHRIYRPGKVVCNSKSPPNFVGKFCSEHSECNFIAAGEAIAGSNEDKIVFYLNDTTGEQIQYITRNAEFFTLEITNGSSLGYTTRLESARIENRSGVIIGTWTLALRVPGTVDEYTNWRVTNTHGGAGCDYEGTDLQKLCVFQDSTPELEQQWLSSCEDDPNDPTKPPCQCRVQDTCDSDGRILLFLNRSKPGHQEYLEELRTTISETLKTCGALPLSRKPYPYNFSYGKPCTTNATCQDDVFPKCVPGVTCKCCANISVTCSANSECAQYEAGSFCGCKQGIDNATQLAELGKRCCANTSVVCQNHGDCSEYLEGSTCGCLPGYPVCGPYVPPGSTGLQPHIGYGQPCVYAGTLQSRYDPVEQVEAVTMFRSNSCEAPVYAYDGTRNARIFNQLIFFRNEFDSGELAGRGSTRIEFYANLLFCQIALKNLFYLTYNPMFPKYNRCVESIREPHCKCWQVCHMIMCTDVYMHVRKNTSCRCVAAFRQNVPSFPSLLLPRAASASMHAQNCL